MLDEELLPCPFCGGKPGYQPWHGGAPTKILVSCKNEYCTVLPMTTGETKSEGFENWNTRTNTWKPIETATKDGRLIFLAKINCNLKEGILGMWWTTGGSWDQDAQRWTDGLDNLAPPTHWMPIPAPPKANE